MEIHRELAAAALREVIGLQSVHGRPAEDVVGEYYDRLPPRTRLVVTHDDPLWLAFEMAGDDAPAPGPGDWHYREVFEAVRRRVLGTELPRYAAH